MRMHVCKANYIQEILRFASPSTCLSTGYLQNATETIIRFLSLEILIEQ